MNHDFLFLVNEKIRTAVVLLALAMSFFFWVRGIVRGNNGDLAAGLVLLIIIVFGAMAVVQGCSCVCLPIGGLLFLFGIATLVTGLFAKPDSLIKRQDRIATAVLFIILGVFFACLIT